MKKVTAGMEPAAMLDWFERISDIPRGSGKEEKIASFLCDFAVSRGLDFRRDGRNNVVILRPADPPFQGKPPVALQGHTDMVCDKLADCSHDFEKEPLELYVENGFLRARGTTLGGDDGIGVAAMLALLDGAAGQPLPGLECVFTVEEETGMGGALSFDWKALKSTRMINLDTEQDGEAVAGCCGGERCSVTLSVPRTSCKTPCYRLTLGGLAGGHSGTDIHRARANANILAGCLLKALQQERGARLITLDGGSKDNAIARECCLAFSAQGEVADFVSHWEQGVKEALSAEDSGFYMALEPLPESDALSAQATQALAGFLRELPNGVLSFCPGLDLPQTSSNLGVISTDRETISFDISVRSSSSAELNAACEHVAALAEAHGMACRRHSRYPGWERKPKSFLESSFCRIYEEEFGRRPTVTVIHAGLECGIASGQRPDMDILSIGPTILDIHSPSEALDLESCRRFWRLLCRILTECAKE